MIQKNKNKKKTDARFYKTTKLKRKINLDELINETK